MIRFVRQFDPHAIRLLIFDLDGTLIDSRLDLIHSVNATLRQFGRPNLPGELIATYVGDGAPMLVRRALGDPEDEQLFRSALEYFLAYYRLHKLDHTVVYEGIPEALAYIADGSCGTGTPARPDVADECRAGIPSLCEDSLRAGSAGPKADKSVRPTRRMAVLSNKPVNPSRDILKALGLGDFFVSIYGGNSFPTKKPDPLGVQTILQETGVVAAETLMIGDSAIDILTGRNAGLWTCGVTYGFAPHTLEDVPPDVVIGHPTELVALFR